MVRREDPETYVGGDLILGPVVLVRIAPVTADVAVQKCGWRLFGALQCFQGSRRYDDTPKNESRRSDDDLPAPARNADGIVIARFCQNRHRNSGHSCVQAVVRLGYSNAFPGFRDAKENAWTRYASTRSL